MSLPLKLLGAVLFVYLALTTLGAEVVHPPPDRAQAEYAAEAARGADNLLVVPVGADTAAARRSIRILGALYLVLAGGLSYWAWLDWRARRRTAPGP